MTKMKPEDVMREKKDDRKLSHRIRGYVDDPESTGRLYYGEWGALRPDQRRLIRKLCDECDAFEKDADNIAMQYEDLLSEKDARIKELEEAQGAEFTCFVGDPHKVDRCPYGDELARLQKEVAEKDAEIERLTINMNAYGLTAKNLAQEFEDYRADVQMEIAYARSEAITEFAEKAKKRLPVISPSVFEQIAKELKGEQNGKTDD